MGRKILNKEEAKSFAQVNIVSLDQLAPKLRKDRELVKDYVKLDGKNLAWADKKLQDDFEIVKIAVSNDGLSLAHASNELKANKEIVYLAVLNNHDAIMYADESLFDDRNFMLELLKINGEIIEWLDEKYFNDEEIMLTTVKTYPSALECSSLSIDVKLALKLLSQNPKTFKYMNSDIRNNDLVFLEAISLECTNIIYINEETLNRPGVLAKILEILENTIIKQKRL